MVGPRNAFVKGFRGPVAYPEDGGFTGDGRAGGKRPFSAGRYRLPRVGAGGRMFPREPFCAGAESPKAAPQRASGSPVQPCGLVCEVMARRIGHTGRGLVGLEVRVLVQAFALNPTWAGWHHHVALCLLAGAFLLSLQQSWGGKMPRITRPQVYRVVREMLPRERFGPEELLRLLEAEQLRNQRASCSHAKRRAALRASRNIPP